MSNQSFLAILYDTEISIRSENRTLLPAPTCLRPICVRSSEYCHGRYASVNLKTSATKRSFGSCPRRMTEQSSPASDDFRVCHHLLQFTSIPESFLAFFCRTEVLLHRQLLRSLSVVPKSASTFEKSIMFRTTWPTTSSDLRPAHTQPSHK